MQDDDDNLPARREALRTAMRAIGRCDPADREELLLSILQRMWGQAPVESLLEDDLEGDAHFWALSATPAMLTAYLSAIVHQFEDARAGAIVRRYLARVLFGGEAAEKIPAAEPPPSGEPNPPPAIKTRRPPNPRYAAVLERRRKARGAGGKEAAPPLAPPSTQSE